MMRRVAAIRSSSDWDESRDFEPFQDGKLRQPNGSVALLVAVRRAWYSGSRASSAASSSADWRSFFMSESSGEVPRAQRPATRASAEAPPRMVLPALS